MVDKTEISALKEVEKFSIFTATLKPVDVPTIVIQIDNHVVEADLDTGVQKSFISNDLLKKYF